jgi:hypothetical protein
MPLSDKGLLALQNALDWAQAHQDNFDMSGWIRVYDRKDKVTPDNICNTTACLAGTLVLLSPDYAISNHGWWGYMPWSNKHWKYVDWDNAAFDILDAEEDPALRLELSRLFLKADLTLPEVWAEANFIAEGRLRLPSTTVMENI